MIYELINKADGKVIGNEIAGSWRHAIYKLRLIAQDHIAKSCPGMAFNNFRPAREGEATEYAIRSEKGDELDVCIDVQEPIARHHPVIKQDGPITHRQAAFLRRHGHDIPSGATKKWASAVIADIIGS